MRTICLHQPLPCPQELRPRLARLTRHLQARLLDFGPGGPRVLAADQASGRVEAVFPGRSTPQVLAALARHGIHAAGQETAVFFLSPDIAFEDLDYLWGCLFDILS